MSNTYGRTFLGQLSAHRAPHAPWHRGDVRVLCKREEHVVMPWRLLFWHNHVHKQASTEHVQPARLDTVCLYPGTCTHMHLTCVMFRGSFRAGMKSGPRFHKRRQTQPRRRESPISSLYTDLTNTALAPAVLLARL
jgi:hypothetical protein